MDLSPSISADTAAEAPPTRPAEAAEPPATGRPRATGPDPLVGPADPDLLILPTGLPGFPDARAFRLRPLPGGGDFAMLESVEPDGPRFVVLEVVEPEPVFGAAAVAEAATALGIAAGDLSLLAIVTLADGPAGRRAHVNLRAPIAVDRIRRIARQLVLADPSLPLRHPLEPRATA